MHAECKSCGGQEGSHPGFKGKPLRGQGMKLKVQWGPQEVGDARNAHHLLPEVTVSEQSQPRREAMGLHVSTTGAGPPETSELTSHHSLLPAGAHDLQD